MYWHINQIQKMTTKYDTVFEHIFVKNTHLVTNLIYKLPNL